MKKYKVLGIAGEKVTIDGVDYTKDDVVELSDEVAEAALADSKVELAAEDADAGEGAGGSEEGADTGASTDGSNDGENKPVLVKYTIVADEGVDGLGEKGAVVELDPESEQVEDLLNDGAIEEVTE